VTKPGLCKYHGVTKWGDCRIDKNDPGMPQGNEPWSPIPGDRE